MGPVETMDEEIKTHHRRVRYRGTHPRKFSEKYKELHPEEYAADVQRVLQRGRTPAGTHRPICVSEIVEILHPRPGEVGLDATVGYGGHARRLLEELDHRGRLLAIDADPIELPKTEERLRRLGFSEEVLLFRRMNFAGIEKLLTEVPEGFDFILADLGVSSMQLDNPSRGFTFKDDGPLDLRMNPQRGEPASELIRRCDRATLEGILRENSDEPFWQEIAQAIFSSKDRLQRTGQLVDLVSTTLSSLKRRDATAERGKSIVRTFQAFRIEVNDELGALERFLEALPSCLRPGGRVAILSFHSGEDRRVKKSFKKGLLEGVYSKIAPDPIRPSGKEQFDNPRSSSAKLRWAIKAESVEGFAEGDVGIPSCEGENL